MLSLFHKSTNMEQQETEKEYSPEELEALQTEQTELMDKQIFYLEKIKTLEALKAEIEEARFRQARAAMGVAQILAPEPENEPASEPQSRKLKKD